MKTNQEIAAALAKYIQSQQFKKIDLHPFWKKHRLSSNYTAQRKVLTIFKSEGWIDSSVKDARILTLSQLGFEVFLHSSTMPTISEPATSTPSPKEYVPTPNPTQKTQNIISNRSNVSEKPIKKYISVGITVFLVIFLFYLLLPEKQRQTLVFALQIIGTMTASTVAAIALYKLFSNKLN